MPWQQLAGEGKVKRAVGRCARAIARGKGDRFSSERARRRRREVFAVFENMQGTAGSIMPVLSYALVKP